jgi:hypothetical protein
LLRGQAVVWANGTIYYGRVLATTAFADGWYRFRVRVAALNPPETGGVWATVHTGLCVSSAPLLEFADAFEAQPEPRDVEFVARLPRRHMLEIRPGDSTLKQAKFSGGQIGTGEGEPQQVPGIAIERLSMERIHLGPDDAAVRQLVVGDVPLEPQADTGGWRAKPSVPEADLERLITALARRAFRRPVAGDDVAGAVSLARHLLSQGATFERALRAGYRAVLVAPEFLYFVADPGPLDDHALAARLSYFLTGEHRPYDRKQGIHARLEPFEDFVRVRTKSQGVQTGLGAWEVAARFSNIVLNDKNVKGNNLTDFTIGLNWYLNPYTRWKFNYIRAFLEDERNGNSLTDAYGTRIDFDF